MNKKRKKDLAKLVRQTARIKGFEKFEYEVFIEELSYYRPEQTVKRDAYRGVSSTKGDSHWD